MISLFLFHPKYIIIIIIIIIPAPTHHAMEVYMGLRSKVPSLLYLTSVRFWVISFTIGMPNE